MILVNDLWKAFGARDLFSGAQLEVTARDRVAVVGPNGAGKTTLFDMIAGEQQPDRGDMNIVRGAVVGYLKQETDTLRGRPLLEEVLRSGSEVALAGHRLEVLQAEIEAARTDEDRDRALEEYGHLQERYAALGGYNLEFEAKRILSGLGFAEEQMDLPTDSFSGGWLMRVALAKLLLSGPDIVMLDEPTNHLDVESVEWLERYLKSYEGAVLLISHDRDFINAIATKVVEIEGMKLDSYPGNFESFVRLREEKAAQREAAAKNQARQIAHQKEFIDRFRYKASKARQVQSRIKMLEKMEKVESPAAKRRNLKIRFPQPPRPGRVVLEFSEARFGYGEKLVYESLDLVLERGQKIALVGPNGAGKTTLLKLVAGVLTPQAGERTVGHNVSIGYFAQHQIEALDDSKRVIEELQGAMPPNSTLRPRDLLGRFLFSGDDIDKPVRVLSGGERTRLALAKILVSPVNLLCLDEPTNHLDMPSRDALEDALEDYEGAIVLITHDRHLIRNVADRIVEVVDGKITDFIGDYDYYLAKRQEAAEPSRPAPAPRSPKKDMKNPADRRRQDAMTRSRARRLKVRVGEIERDLQTASAEADQLARRLADPSFYSSGQDVAAAVREYESMTRKVRKLETDWEEAAAAVEEFDAKEAASSA